MGTFYVLHGEWREDGIGPTPRRADDVMALDRDFLRDRAGHLEGLRRRVTNLRYSGSVLAEENADETLNRLARSSNGRRVATCDVLRCISRVVLKEEGSRTADPIDAHSSPRADRAQPPGPTANASTWCLDRLTAGLPFAI